MGPQQELREEGEIKAHENEHRGNASPKIAEHAPRDFGPPVVQSA